MSDSSPAFLRLADQTRSRIKEVSPMELSRAKPWPVVIDAQTHMPQTSEDPPVILIGQSAL